MKIYVVCDVEGTAGVVDHAQQCCWDVKTRWYGEYLNQARRLATLELNAFLEGALAAGATEIVAWDGHANFPGGLDIELIHSECRVILSAGDRGPAGLDSSFDAVAQVGLHAMAGTPGSVLGHGKWRINGQYVGEIGMSCLLAGCYGLPCVFLSGDRAAAHEARGLVPEIETVIVKEGLNLEWAAWSPSPALSLSPVKARDLIREGATRALTRIGDVSPLRIQPPYSLEWFFANSDEADGFMAGNETARRVDDTTVEVRGIDLLELVS